MCTIRRSGKHTVPGSFFFFFFFFVNLSYFPITIKFVSVLVFMKYIRLKIMN